MRNMSFSMTTGQIINRTKTVTRRFGWWRLGPGEKVRAVGFVATLPNMGHKNIYRESRLVVLPEWQGVGFGKALSEGVAKLYISQNKRYSSTTSHPGMIKSRDESDVWKITGIKKRGGGKQTNMPQYISSGGRCVVSFEYMGE